MAPYHGAMGDPLFAVRAWSREPLPEAPRDEDESPRVIVVDMDVRDEDDDPGASPKDMRAP